jgi:starch-binding outer membrane protein, SusD/RagB family
MDHAPSTSIEDAMMGRYDTGDRRGIAARSPFHETRVRRVARWRTGAGVIVTALGLAGCDGLLDVSNPNELIEEELSAASTARSLANGALSTVARAYGEMLLLHGAASDELQFTGSRDAWLQLQVGDLRDPANEFSDAAYPFVNEGRWMADEAVHRLVAFDEDGVLVDRTVLARARLYSAMIYTQIADLWEDFTISDRRDPGAPLGQEGMLGMYDRALENLDAALPIAEAANSQALEAAILAQRARTKHAKAVRSMLTPAGSAPTSGLVADAGAVADAQAALARVPNPDWQFRFGFSDATVSNNWGAWVNERLELRVSNTYVQATADGKRVAEITLLDPIDQVPDPALTRVVEEAVASRQYGPVTVVSARELHLILAEAALATGDEGGFSAAINALRSLDGLTPYSGQLAPEELLRYSRMGNLYYTGRRLLDHYRFGTQSSFWSPNREAAQRPGTLFPITQIERRANCHILGTCP